METTTLKSTARPVTFIDLTTPRPPRQRSPRMVKLLNLEPGESTRINHSKFKTGFAAWIAQARARTGRNYGYRQVRKNLYEVFVNDQQSAAA
jgi:hypothetical protein